MAQVWDDILRQRISRRRVLAGSTALGAAGITLVACKSDGGKGGNPTGEPVAEGTPKPGGFLKLRQPVPFPNFNPFGPGIAALSQGLFLGYTVFDHLWFVPTDTGEVINFLADEIEVIDDVTIRVTLANAVFHNRPPVNGRAVKSTDVKASAEKFKEQVPFGYSWLHEIYDNMEAPDDKTVIYHQKRPWFWFFTSSNAGSPWTSAILPEETLDDEQLLQEHPIGSGRWEIAGHDAFANVRLSKFANWRETGLPYLDGVNFVLTPDDTLAQAAFEAQDIHQLGGLNHEELADIENRLGDAIRSSSDLSRSYRTLQVKYEGVFVDERIRHAINLALDREEARQILDLGDGELSGPIPPAHQKYVLPDDDPDLQEYFRHNPEEARALLEQADFPFDEEFELKYHTLPGNPELAGIIQQQLSRVGIQLKLTGEDISRWLANTLGPGNYQLTAFTHLPYEDPSLPMSFYREPNFMGYQDDDVEAAMDAAATEPDEAARIEKTKEAQRVLIRKWAPQFTLYSPTSYTVTRSYVKGLVEGRGSFGLFNSKAWLDQ